MNHTEPTMGEVLARLQTLERELAVARGARRGGERAGRRRGARPLATLATALLMALVPLSLFAANPFTDLDPGQDAGHNPNIDAIYNAGITTGCAPTEYCPKEFVTREQMASFLARTAGLGNNPPVANARTAQFADGATNATNAQNAINAQNAGNASTVGGYAPAGLTRLAFASVTSQKIAAPPGPATKIVETKIVVPQPSYVRVSFTSYAFLSNPAGCPCMVAAYIEGANLTPLAGRINVGTEAADFVDGADRRDLSGSHVFFVPAGIHTFGYVAGLDAGTSGNVTIANAQLQAEIFPFDALGAPATEP
jgi:hypothetical protein